VIFRHTASNALHYFTSLTSARRLAESACLYTHCGGRDDVRQPGDPDSPLDRHCPRRLVNWRPDTAYPFIHGRLHLVQKCNAVTSPIYT